jgi:autotransporter-associated beta strand protein
VVVRYQGDAFGLVSENVTTYPINVEGQSYTVHKFTQVGPDTLTLPDLNQRLAVTITSPITGSGSLNFAGPGTLVLAADNEYSGNTNIQTGTLLVNGSIASDVIVADGGTLGGQGRLPAVLRARTRVRSVPMG